MTTNSTSGGTLRYASALTRSTRSLPSKVTRKVTTRARLSGLTHTLWRVHAGEGERERDFGSGVLVLLLRADRMTRASSQCQVGNKWRNSRLANPIARTIEIVKRWRSVAVAIGLVATVAGCSRGCNQVGCGSLVGVDLSKVAAQFGTAPVTATLCVNGNCQTNKVAIADKAATKGISQPVPTESLGDTEVTVTLKLERDGQVLLATQSQAALTKFTPNGEQCGPVCWVSRLDLVGTVLKQGPPLTLDSTR